MLVNWQYWLIEMYLVLSFLMIMTIFDYDEVK